MNVSKSGSGDKVLDWGVVVAAFILFAKSADILSYFSPVILSEIFGFDISLIYGMVCAGLVEGLALALHFNRRAALSGTAQTVKWVLLGISGLCQIFDGFVTTNSVAQMSDTLKAVLSYGVPLIPLLIMVMLFGIGTLPELDGVSSKEKKPFIGLKGAWNKLINGDTPEEITPQLQPMNLDIPAPELKLASDNRPNEKRVEKRQFHPLGPISMR